MRIPASSTTKWLAGVPVLALVLASAGCLDSGGPLAEITLDAAVDSPLADVAGSPPDSPLSSDGPSPVPPVVDATDRVVDQSIAPPPPGSLDGGSERPAATEAGAMDGGFDSASCLYPDMVWRDSSGLETARQYACGLAVSTTAGSCYNVLRDTCDGYRCLVGSEIASACFTQAQCAQSCAGRCIAIGDPQKLCTGRGGLGGIRTDGTARLDAGPVDCDQPGRCPVSDGGAGIDGAPVVDNNRFIAVSAGVDYTCALQEGGTLMCWGRKDLGQTAPPPGDYASVSTSDWFGCGVLTDGSLRCWGTGSNGETTPPAGRFLQVATGEGFACALDEARNVVCWGGPRSSLSSLPALHYDAVSAGNGILCALAEDHSLRCPGVSFPPNGVTDTGGYTQVSVGGTNICAVRIGGAIDCLANDTLSPGPAPPGTYVQVSTTDWQTCAVTSAGTIACWYSPELDMGTPPTGTFTQVSVGHSHACGLRTDKTIACWGTNRYGESDSPRLTP